MQDKKAIPALINILNPLPFVEAGDELKTHELIRLLCPPVSNVVEPTALIERYKRISSVAMEPVMLPALPILIEKVVSPLANAKVAYVAGNALGIIALCGFVAEMIALMLYEMARDEGIFADVTQDQFESFGQKQRVKLLHDRRVINQDTKVALDLIRDKRRKYLHFITQDYAHILDDASQVYSNSIFLLVGLVGQEFKDGAWIPKPSFARYLRKHGLF